MALTRKAQKETDQAIRRLMDYIDADSKWSECFRQIEIELMEPVANQFGMPLDQALEALLEGPYEGNVYGYLFEETATCNWNNQGSVIDEYLKKRGWREGPHGKKYLRALANADVQVWVTTDVSPGEWVDIQRHAKPERPKRVYEKSASEQLAVGQCLAARVLSIDKKRYFSGSIVPLTESQAELIQDAVAQVTPSTRALYQEMLDEKVIDLISEEEVSKEIEHKEVEVRSNTVFELWAASLLQKDLAVTPTIRNTDDESIVITKHRMKINGETKGIQKELDTYFEPTQPNEWIWLNEQDKVVASIRLKQKNIVIETNSVERGERGIARLQSILGDAIGKPIGVHESLNQVMANLPAEPNPPPLGQEDLQNHPQVKAQMQQYLKNHYRDSLDQPIPMLNDLTPRECAAKPETRDKAIHWLKNMELHNMKTGQVFDTTWMWEALNLTDYR